MTTSDEYLAACLERDRWIARMKGLELQIALVRQILDEGADAALQLPEPVASVVEEWRRAVKAYPQRRVSAHEGFAYLAEEFEELKREVYAKEAEQGRTFRIRREAVQVAAMALRLIDECCDEEGKAEKR